MGLIQTPEQLRFSYMAIIDGAKSIRLGLLNENRSGDVTPIIDEDHISDSPKRTSLETCATTLPLDDSNLRFRRSQGSPPESTQVNQSIQSSSSVSSPSSESSSAATTTNNNSLSSGVEVRRRQREERNKKMEETIRNIKEKQKKIEDRSRFKSRLIRMGLLGCVMICFGAGVFYTYNYYFQNSIAAPTLPHEDQTAALFSSPLNKSDEIFQKLNT